MEYEDHCDCCNCVKLSTGNKVFDTTMNSYMKDSRGNLHKNAGFRLTKSSMGRYRDDDDDDGDRCPYNIVDMFGRRFKKDSRTWLHKSTRKIKSETKTTKKETRSTEYGIFEHETTRVEEPESESSSDSDNPYTIIDSMGRRFKKDSRTWLHKSSSKQKKSKIIEKDDVPELPDTPNNQPGHFFFKDSGERNSERKFHEIIKTGTDISKKHHSNVMRKRKLRCQQISNSTKYSPEDYDHNAEICMILSTELDKTSNKPTAIKRSVSFDNIFELFEEDADDDCLEFRRLSDSRVSNDWRETKPIRSETSTHSSNENREINHSPLSSGASINLSSDTRIKRSPDLTSTARNNCHNKQQVVTDLTVQIPDAIPEVFDDNQTSNCEQYKDNQMLNVNSSRSVNFLIAESDEIVGDAVLSDYEEESD